MTSIHWDSQQFVAILPSTFWPPSHPQPGVGSTHFPPSTASANFEGVKRTITHDAAQMHMSSKTTQSIRYSGDADISDAETEFPSIEELLLPDINGSLSSVHGNVTGSDKLKWGTSQDEPILLDSDVGDNGVLDDVEREILVDFSSSQAALSDVMIQTTTTKVWAVLKKPLT
ncbi:hypothetical protein GMDG_01266 [Pseudogymnoascus destructans 20631-21]|uniref:Uncharacterized protein n=1 Tax=Pseudogymnoascus destructans (strain ATCC MYA-4855 / 20631-21) TaxID=658429 RepID=L8FRA5_PSED2|nr:hypothetical protein GMDG_01266 [Pseudogymnoascus destructans 20631-21]